MIETIERMLSDLERGRLSRRQFAVSLAALAASTSLAPLALATPAPTGFRAVSINHVTVRVPDLHRAESDLPRLPPVRQHVRSPVSQYDLI